MRPLLLSLLLLTEAVISAASKPVAYATLVRLHVSPHLGGTRLDS